MLLFLNLIICQLDLTLKKKNRTRTIKYKCQLINIRDILFQIVINFKIFTIILY